MYIDADTHYTPKEIFENVPSELKDCPHLKYEDGKEKLWIPSLNKYGRFRETMYSVKLREEAMKEAEFDKAILLVANSAIPEPFISLDSTKYLYRQWNNRVASLQKQNNRFVGAAQVPHSNVNAAIEETEYAVNTLGFRAVQLLSSWNGTNIADPSWFPFYEKISQLDIPMWVHEIGMYAPGNLNPYLPGSAQLEKCPAAGRVFMGFLWAMQMIIQSTIFNGLFDKLPNLRFVLTECDIGWIPSYMNWLDESYDVWRTRTPTDKKDFKIISKDDEIKLQKKPSDYMKDNFYYVLISRSQEEVDLMLPILVNKLGMANRIMIETDFDHVEGSLDIVRRIQKLDSIDQEAKDRICGKNAAEILKMPWTPSMYAYAK